MLFTNGFSNDAPQFWGSAVTSPTTFSGEVKFNIPVAVVAINQMCSANLLFSCSVVDI